MSGMAGKKRIEAFRAGAGVTRYHTMLGHKPERVGQHSAEVAAICMILDKNCSGAVLRYALMHDIGEFATGDVPAHVKKVIPGLGAALDAMEYGYTMDVAPEWDFCTEEEQKLVKTADALQLCFYALDEVIGGNHHYEIVFKRGLEYLRAVQWPQAVAVQVNEIAYELEDQFNVYRK